MLYPSCKWGKFESFWWGLLTSQLGVGCSVALRTSDWTSSLPCPTTVILQAGTVPKCLVWCGVVWCGVVSEGVVRMWWDCAWSGVGVPCQCDLTTGLLITCTDQPHQGPVYPGSEVSEVPPVSATQVLLASTLLTSFLLLLAGYICICIIITSYHKPLHYRFVLYRSEKYDFYQKIIVRV